MSVGRGNRKTKKIHAKGLDTDGRLTACNLPQRRRYVRNGNEGAAWAVNCTSCLKATARVRVGSGQTQRDCKRLAIEHGGAHG